MKWFKLYGERWFMGSSRWELSVEQRAVWVDLLARASLNSPPGQINYYSLEQLAAQFNIELALLKSTISRCKEVKKINFSEKTKKITIINWRKYQSEYERQLPYRQGLKGKSKVTETGGENCNKVTPILEKKRKDKKREEENNETIVPNDNYNRSKSPSINFNFNNRSWKGITSEDLELWGKSYPACDIELELSRMMDWLVSHPDRRKKKYRPFITRWLSKQQDRGGTRSQFQSGSNKEMAAWIRGGDDG